MRFIPVPDEGDDKSGYNRSARIIESLGNLTNSYIFCMSHDNFTQALNCIRRILDLISGKVKEEEIEKFDKTIDSIDKEIPLAEAIYKYNGKVYIKDVKTNKKVKRDIETLFRHCERLQNRYGYGMVSQDDPRMAVTKR